MFESPIGSLVAMAVCLVTLVLTILTRVGVLRFWMSPHAENWQLERLVLLGLPLVAVTAFALALMTAPVETPVLRLIGGAILLLTVVPWVVTVFLPMIRIPGILYPRWAREMMSRRMFGRGRWGA
ncbi:hypothetical protein [Brachybacterium sp. UMB0905]|uniref:hypothetical protein n=1 Tax=Brachybacterium sp. UMB0905 TaxID=2069310 RepID=UPI000C8068EF|nr:hypothetical protein [Brachybacterium sp. UMB0905]PMC76874.1 hypothetical protein CJ197_00725 [Brachybacterium sp. UMB0905]